MLKCGIGEYRVAVRARLARRSDSVGAQACRHRREHRVGDAEGAEQPGAEFAVVAAAAGPDRIDAREIVVAMPLRLADGAIRLYADTVRFTCSWMRDDMRGLARILPLYTESLKRLMASGTCNWCMFVTPVAYTGMVEFVKRRCAKWGSFFGETKVPEESYDTRQTRLEKEVQQRYGARS